MSLPHQYTTAALSEECGEVVQIIGKVFRFGLHASHDGKTNLELLHEEVGDILGTIDYAIEQGLLDREKLVLRSFEKKRNLVKWAPEGVGETTEFDIETAERGMNRLWLIPIMVILLGLVLGSVYVFTENQNLNALEAYQTCLDEQRDDCHAILENAQISLD